MAWTDTTYRCARGTKIRIQAHFEKFLLEVIQDYNKAEVEARPEVAEYLKFLGHKLSTMVVNAK